MERESARKKEMLEKAAAAPAESVPSKTPAPQASQTSTSAAPELLPEKSDATLDTQDQHQITQLPKATPEIPTEAQRDIPQMSIEVRAQPGRFSTRHSLNMFSHLVSTYPDEILPKRLAMGVMV